MSLSSETNAVTFSSKFSIASESFASRIFSESKSRIFGDCLSDFSRQPTRNLRRRFRSGARSEPLNPEGRNRQIDILFKDLSLSLDPLRSQNRKSSVFLSELLRAAVPSLRRRACFEAERPRRRTLRREALPVNAVLTVGAAAYLH